TQIPLSISPVAIDINIIKIFTIILLVVTAVLSSFVLGLITKGEEKEGLKYIPILTSSAVIVFFVVRIAIVKLLGIFF
ncbi:MAG: hypothetical protein QXW65_03470, partial [Candidatus Pacearchaeota archaeon]